MTKIRWTAAVILAAAAALSLSWRPLFFQNQIPLTGNLIALFYPNWSLARSVWTGLRLPLWDAARNLGEPYLADPQTMALYPPLLLASLLPSFIGFMRAWVIFHTLIAALFLGALAHRRWKDPAATASAALIAGLNGFFTSRLSLLNHFASAAWLPAILYFEAAESPLGMGVCFSFCWLSGFPPFFLVIVAMVGVLACSRGRTNLMRFLQGLAWALGFSAIQWAPFLELLVHSVRPVILNSASATQYSISPLLLLKEILIPQWYALFPSMEGDPAIVTFYVGLIALVLAAWGWRRGGKEEKTLAFICVLGFIFSLGGYLPVYAAVPVFRIFRFPANWLLASSVAAGLLCAAGVFHLPKKWRWPAAILIAADLILFAQFPRQAWARPAFLTDTPLLVESLKRLPQPVRIFHTKPLYRLWQASSLKKEDDYLLMRDFLAPSFGIAYGIQELRSYQVLRTRLADRYLKRLDAEGPHSRLLDYTGAAAIVTLSVNAQRLSRGVIKVILRPQAKILPRLFIAAGGKGDVKITAYRSGHIEAIIRSPVRATVVFSEIDYPGWNARLDGRKVSHQRFEGAFPAIAVSPGMHHISFDFSPESFWIGLAVTLSTFFGWALWMILDEYSIFKKKRLRSNDIAVNTHGEPT